MDGPTQTRHRLLERQVRRARDASGALDLDRLLDLVSAAYAEQDEARRMTDHSVRLMSAEVHALNEKVRFEAAAEARATEERLYGLLETIADGVIVLDADGRVVAFNGAAESMFRRSREAVKGRSFLDLGLTDQPELPGFIIGPMRESTAEIEVFRGDGEPFTAEVTTASITVDRARRSVTLWRDITARKFAEDALRTARDEARAANRAKTDFLANMSHEIRTPLNGVLGLAGALNATSLTTAQRDMVRIMLSSGEQLTAILSDLLDLAKIEAGRLELEQAPFELRELLSGTAGLFQASAISKGLSLVTDFGPGVELTAVGDSGRLRQVVQNLLSNAIKFTAQGSVTLWARVTYSPDDIRPLVQVEVRDSGCGVPEEARGRLFTRFTQADSSTTRKFGGTGLGLALCRELLGAMGGDIGMRPNDDGVGACFWFSVKLGQGETAVDRTAPSIEEGAPNLAGLHVLAVDDNATNRFVLKTILEAIGCTATLAEDGREAVNLARDHAFDAILMDVHMPVLDGIQATRQIRRLRGASAHTPIIAVTAEAMPEQVRRALDAGVDSHITKPIQPGKLMRALAEAVAATPTGRAALYS